jgi:hypothetical protein
LSNHVKTSPRIFQSNKERKKQTNKRTQSFEKRKYCYYSNAMFQQYCNSKHGIPYQTIYCINFLNVVCRLHFKMPAVEELHYFLLHQLEPNGQTEMRMKF